jgi:hypothetical protein
LSAVHTRTSTEGSCGEREQKVTREEVMLRIAVLISVHSSGRTPVCQYRSSIVPHAHKNVTAARHARARETLTI